MPLLSFLLSHYLLTSQIILHQGKFVGIEEPLVYRAENENVSLDLVFFSIIPQESCHCVLGSEIIGVWVKYEGEIVEDLLV